MSDDVTRPAAVVRRAPFSDNPTVGPRGLRTQQRILDAALGVLGDVGYHQCSIQRITEAAGCSRAGFYQYFSSREDVFRHLAAVVGRQLDAATDQLEPVTADAGGRARLRAWVGRYAEIYDQYEAVFHTFQSAADGDVHLAEEFERSGHRYVTGLLSRISTDHHPPHSLEPMVGLLLTCLTRTLDDLSLLHTSSPAAYPSETVLDAYCDVAHRAFFGVIADVNVHEARTPAPERMPFGPVMRAAVAGARSPETGDGSTRRTLAAAAREVFVANGFHGTRIDAIVESAGVSHGTFYHYFDNKGQLAQELAAEAMRTVSTTLQAIPDVAGTDGRDDLRRWLRAYNRAQADETSMIRVWVDAALQDESIRTEAAAVLEWGRRQMARFLEAAGVGDIEIDAVVLLALLDGLGVRERPRVILEAALDVIERGFLGREL